jgi:hypothetical protein
VGEDEIAELPLAVAWPGLAGSQPSTSSIHATVLQAHSKQAEDHLRA